MPLQQRNPLQATLSRATDPANESHFTVEYRGIFVGWFREVSGLSAEVETLDWPEGGQNAFAHALPGRVKYPNLVLKAGVTSVGALQDWLFDSQKYGPRHPVTVRLKARRGGGNVRTWVFQNAFVVKWTGPNLNVASNNPAVETLELKHQGLQRP